MVVVRIFGSRRGMFLRLGLWVFVRFVFFLGFLFFVRRLVFLFFLICLGGVRLFILVERCDVISSVKR